MKLSEYVFSKVWDIFLFKLLSCSSYVCAFQCQYDTVNINNQGGDTIIASKYAALVFKTINDCVGLIEDEFIKGRTLIVSDIINNLTSNFGDTKRSPVPYAK